MSGYEESRSDALLGADKGEGSSLAVLSALRGRSLLLILLAFALGGPLAYLGWQSTAAMYETSGLLEVRPSREAVFDTAGIGQEQGYFRDYLETQILRMKGREVIGRALADPAMVAAEFPSGDRGRRELTRMLKIEPPPGGQVIEVAVEHANPWWSEQAVNAIMRTYLTVHEEEQRARFERAVSQVDRREEAVRDRLEALRESARPLLERFGSGAALDRQLATLDSAVLDMGAEVRSASATLDRIDAEINRKTEMMVAKDAGEPVAGPSQIELALDDDRVNELDEERRRLELRIQSNLDAGLQPTHNAVMSDRLRLSDVRLMIEDRLETLEELWWARLRVEIDELRTDALVQRSTLMELDSQREEIEGERGELTSAIQKVAEFEDKIAEARTELEQVLSLRDDIELQLAEESLGLVRVLEWSEFPEEPASDSRPLRAVAGGLAGIVVSGGLVMLGGGLGRRLRYIDEMTPERVGAGVLGAVPEIKKLTSDSFAELEQCVEPMRARIEVASAKPGSRGISVLAVTSPGPSDGKSTIARALATSFARAGHRTVLVDADPDGRATTAAYAMSGEPGFVDFLAEPDLTMIRASGRSGLWILPAGRVDERSRTSSYAAVERLIEELRGHFEQVVIDTGGVLGSAESNLFGRAADGMVLVVARGKSDEMVARALTRIRDVGGHCVGIIFNRAQRTDFVRTSVAVSSIRRDAGDPGVVSAVPPGSKKSSGEQRSSAARA